jgi:hypothetical protein
MRAISKEKGAADHAQTDKKQRNGKQACHGWGEVLADHDRAVTTRHRRHSPTPAAPKMMVMMPNFPH